MPRPAEDDSDFLNITSQNNIVRPVFGVALSYPQMVEAMKDGKYPFVMCNLAPPDMVGHTGVYQATVVACEATGTRKGRGCVRVREGRPCEG